MTATALFIGRFQPFHNGHKHAIEAAQDEYDVIIGVGSAETGHTRENPLTFEERRRLLHHCLGDDCQIHGIPDHDNDADWMAYIEEQIPFDTGISGNDHVRQIFSDHGHEIQQPDYRRPDYFSGTAIREAVRNREQWRDRVPACSVELLDEYGFVERVREIG